MWRYSPSLTQEKKVRVLLCGCGNPAVIVVHYKIHFNPLPTGSPKAVRPKQKVSYNFFVYYNGLEPTSLQPIGSFCPSTVGKELLFSSDV